MNRHLSGKLIAALIMGLLLGLSFVHSSQLVVRHGRQAFMIAQEHRFDRFTSAPHTFIHILGVIIATCLFLFFYELLAFGAQRTLKAPTSVFTEK
ncbi:hypothetical protein RBB77_15135 [Tunturibacter psychrotolerans]|uniref:Uncharacterized protein n=1 Tax=Tunturiibacter psychrotolerans TaxID=3069686 RepID=A0AAU7ZL18_9BACT